MNELLAQIYNDIKEIAYHTTKDHESAADLTQELCLKLLENPQRTEKLHAEGDLLRWLYRVARNKHYDQHRKQQGHLQEESPDTFDTIAELEWIRSNLDHIEYLWIEAYLDHDGNYSKLADFIGGSRRHVAIRIKEIKQKICTLKSTQRQSD